MHAERRVSRVITNFQSGGIAIFGKHKEEGRSGVSFVLDSSPEIDRPGGHSEEKDPNRSRGDREHLRGVESPDRNLQIGFQN